MLRQSSVRPTALPFAEKVDLIFAFSIFTHSSGHTQREVLDRLHQNLADGVVLVVTVRPLAYPPYIDLQESGYPKDYIFAA